MSGRTGFRPAHLDIHPTAFLAPGAVVVGDVSIGARSSVWFHAVLRGDSDRIEIGDHTNVQDHTVVHVDEGQPALVGARVTIGHRAIVHGCVIEDDCLIGMGAIVLSGARIGAGSLVGAGALVREGQQIPNGSLVVGAPARVAGDVRPAHREAIARGAEHYAELAGDYLARGFGRMHPVPDSVRGLQPAPRSRMSEQEWHGALEVLAETSEWIVARHARTPEGAWRMRPGPERWSAAEVAAHLRDTDREVALPRLGRLLTERLPAFAYIDLSGAERVRGWGTEDSAAVVQDFRAARAEVLAGLEPLGPREWERVAVHSVLGSITLAGMVRAWADHDLGHRRQIESALRSST